MMISVIEDHDAILGQSQGYKGLPVRREDLDGQPGLTSAWEPTPAELEALMRGAKIHVSIIGLAHPPIYLSVGDVPGSS